MISANDGWAIGGVHYDRDNYIWLGTILHWDGSVWESYENPAEGYLFSIDMISATDGWAVGHSGTQSNYSIVLHWNGAKWNSVSVPTNEQLNSVSMISATDGWIVGSNGTFLKWNGTSWVNHIAPTGTHMEVVKMISAYDGWAMGEYGTILHWDGYNWEPTESPVGLAPLSISMLASNDGWAVGVPGSIIKWDGDQWKGVNIPHSYMVNRISMVSTEYGWASGYSYDHWRYAFLKWDGITWQVTDLPINGWINSIEMVSEIDGWALSWNGENSEILHWNGDSWNPVFNPMQTTELLSIDVLSTNNAWIVGNNATILKWDGSVWSLVPTNNITNTSYFDIAMTSIENGWAVGGYCLPFSSPSIIHWDGNNWEQFEINDPDIECGLWSIEMLSQDYGWISGNNGYLLRWDGGTWRKYSSPGGYYYSSIEMVTQNSSWVVGDMWGPFYTGCRIGYWDGYVWTSIWCPTNRGLATISRSDPTDFWAGSSFGLLHYSGPSPIFHHIFLPNISYSN